MLMMTGGRLDDLVRSKCDELFNVIVSVTPQHSGRDRGSAYMRFRAKRDHNLITLDVDDDGSDGLMTLSVQSARTVENCSTGPCQLFGQPASIQEC